MLTRYCRFKQQGAAVNAVEACKESKLQIWTLGHLIRVRFPYFSKHYEPRNFKTAHQNAKARNVPWKGPKKAKNTRKTQQNAATINGRKLLMPPQHGEASRATAPSGAPQPTQKPLPTQKPMNSYHAGPPYFGSGQLAPRSFPAAPWAMPFVPGMPHHQMMPRPAPAPASAPAPRQAQPQLVPQNFVYPGYYPGYFHLPPPPHFDMQRLRDAAKTQPKPAASPNVSEIPSSSSSVKENKKCNDGSPDQLEDVEIRPRRTREPAEKKAEVEEDAQEPPRKPSQVETPRPNKKRGHDDNAPTGSMTKSDTSSYRPMSVSQRRTRPKNLPPKPVESLRTGSPCRPSAKNRSSGSLNLGSGVSSDIGGTEPFPDYPWPQFPRRSRRMPDYQTASFWQPPPQAQQGMAMANPFFAPPATQMMGQQFMGQQFPMQPAHNVPPHAPSQTGGSLRAPSTNADSSVEKALSTMPTRGKKKYGKNKKKHARDVFSSTAGEPSSPIGEPGSGLADPNITSGERLDDNKAVGGHGEAETKERRLNKKEKQPEADPQPTASASIESVEALRPSPKPKGKEVDRSAPGVFSAEAVQRLAHEISRGDATLRKQTPPSHASQIREENITKDNPSASADEPSGLAAKQRGRRLTIDTQAAQNYGNHRLPEIRDAPQPRAHPSAANQKEQAPSRSKDEASNKPKGKPAYDPHGSFKNFPAWFDPFPRVPEHRRIKPSAPKPAVQIEASTSTPENQEGPAHPPSQDPVVGDANATETNPEEPPLTTESHVPTEYWTPKSGISSSENSRENSPVQLTPRPDSSVWPTHPANLSPVEERGSPTDTEIFMGPLPPVDSEELQMAGPCPPRAQCDGNVLNPRAMPFFAPLLRRGVSLITGGGSGDGGGHGQPRPLPLTLAGAV